MSVHADAQLPSNEELTVQEVNLTTCYMKAAAHHVGKYCDHQGKEFMLCKNEERDPRKCLGEGKAVTACALDFFRRLKASCHQEYDNYAKCINYSSADFRFKPCRKTQAVYDKCVLDKMGIERPELGYFSLPRVHHTNRPKPEKKELEFPNQPVELPDDYPREPGKYGNRVFFSS